jgi:hypothetical protein
MTDQWQWWREALAGKTQAIVESEPRSGYFKMRKGKDGPWLPVVIWEKDGALVCRVADDVKDPHDVWTWCAGNPVAKEAAKQAFETGSWPGDVPQIGDNSGTLSLPEEIDDATSQALQWLTTSGVTDKVTADMAANYRARMLDLSKRADKQRETEKRPHDDAAKAVQAKWKPYVDKAADTAVRLRDALSKFLAAEEAKARKAAEEAARIENEKRMAEFRRQQEEAAKAAATAPKDEPPLPLEAPTFVAPEPVKIQAGGQRGKKASLRTLTKYEISDFDAALAHVKNSPDVRAAVEKVAFAQARAGATVPGVRSYEEKVAV